MLITISNPTLVAVQEAPDIGPREGFTVQSRLTGSVQDVGYLPIGLPLHATANRFPPEPFNLSHDVNHATLVPISLAALTFACGCLHVGSGGPELLNKEVLFKLTKDALYLNKGLPHRIRHDGFSDVFICPGRYQFDRLPVPVLRL